jgi:hypothetical protein
MFVNEHGALTVLNYTNRFLKTRDAKNLLGSILVSMPQTGLTDLITNWRQLQAGAREFYASHWMLAGFPAIGIKLNLDLILDLRSTDSIPLLISIACSWIRQAP